MEKSAVMSYGTSFERMLPSGAAAVDRGTGGLCDAIPSRRLNRWCGLEWANVRVGVAGVHLGVDSSCLSRMPFRVLRLSTITVHNF